MNFEITFDFLQFYLPTKRHKITQKRKMVTCRDIEVRELSKEDFPVAIKVTDFNILAHDWDSDEDKFDTIEYRWDGECLYEEPREKSGSDKGILYYQDISVFMQAIKNHAGQRIYDYTLCEPGKEFDEEKSVITTDDMESRIDNMIAFASQFVICDGKVWKKCGQPYYKVQTFGLGNNHGGTGFFIEWTYEPSISKEYFLATQRSLALKDFTDTAKGRGDTDSLSSEKERENIEVLIPDAYTLKRDMESSKYAGYMWNDEKECYIKEYTRAEGNSPSHEDILSIRFRHDYGDRCLARVHVDNKYAFTNIASIWYAVGQVLEDCRDVSFEDIYEIYNATNTEDLLSLVKRGEVLA